MAHTKTIQFYRNTRIVGPDTSQGKTALTVAKETLETNGSQVDGEITLIRYQESLSDPVKTLAGIYYQNGNTGEWTYLTEIDPDSYYTKDEIDSNERVIATALAKFDDDIVTLQTTVDENEEVTAVALSDLDNRIINDCLPSSTVIPKGVFKVTITENNGTYTSDKTSSQIYQAYLDGYAVFCESSPFCLFPLFITQGNVAFFTTYEQGYVHIEISNSTVTIGNGSFLTSNAPCASITASKITEWNGKAEKVTVVTVPTSGSVTQALSPNTFYNFTGSLTSLTLTLTAGNGTELDVYAGKFIADSSGCSVMLPNTVTVADSAPAIEGGNTYEFNIVDNVLIYLKV